MGTTHRGTPTGNNHRPTPRKSPQDRAMQAREESLGEASDYDTEAKYAAQYRSSLDEPVDEETYKNHWGSIQEQMADSYRRGY